MKKPTTKKKSSKEGIAIKQIQAVMFGETYFIHAVAEDGSLWMCEEDLKTHDRVWLKISTPFQE